MNFYIVVEGRRTEKKVFSDWIPLLNPRLTRVSLPGELAQDNFVIVSGHGFPQYLETVRQAALDVVQNPQFGHLVISVDAEDNRPEHVRCQVQEVVESVSSALVPTIVVQNACIESWFLGNRRMVRRMPQEIALRDWKDFYDVWEKCPELMPARDELNRAQTAFAYLLAALSDRGSHLRYSKRRPHIVCTSDYLDQLKARADETGHLPSFCHFVSIF